MQNETGAISETKRKCEECGSEYETKGGGRPGKYCSPGCRLRAHRRASVVDEVKPPSVGLPRVKAWQCENCGILFEVGSEGGRPGRFCGDTCRKQYSRKAWKETGQPEAAAGVPVAMESVAMAASVEGALSGQAMAGAVLLPTEPGWDGGLSDDPLLRPGKGIIARDPEVGKEEEKFEVAEEVVARDREDEERLGGWEAGRVCVKVTEAWVNSHLSVGWEWRLAKKRRGVV